MTRVVALAAPIFQRWAFPMPLTITLVTPATAVLVFSISFQRDDAAQAERATGLYHALEEACRAAGIAPYRLGLLSGDPAAYIPPERMNILRALKRALDPNNVIAPGRYGL